MIAASVCSGIGAPECAWRDLGIEFAFCSEIEPFPSAVLAHHYPEVANLGDFTGIDHGSIDLLVGGTPCQSFSVAGKRAGLDDARGDLTIEFALLAARLRPRWLVWENVPGVLSIDEGRTFGAFLGMLGVIGYGFAYRILDAQFFGVAQRRRRVFVVGHLGDWRRAAAVLFERESLSGHPPPCRKTGQGTAHGVEVGPSGDRFTETCPTLDSRAKDGFIRNQLGVGAYVPEIVSQAMSSKWVKGTSGPAGDEVANLVVHSLRADGFDASEDGTAVRRLTPRECERLQGFPDDYTLIEYKGKPAADGARYKALGNAMAVSVMRWIGERIVAVDAIP